jgi:hypothetical protein
VYLNHCFKHEDGGGPNSADLAIIRFSATVSSPKPVPIYLDGDEKGKAFKIVGWGNSGKVGIDE